MPTVQEVFGQNLRCRWPVTSPHRGLEQLIEKNKEHYRSILKDFMRYVDQLAAIPVQAPDDSLVPYWSNIWISGLDVVSLYGFIAINRPKLYLEIGSGNSTKFVRQAIRDGNTGTQIISIDPQPRANIDVLCNQVVRHHLENIDWRPFIAALAPGDILFFDGSHRCLQNSDVTVFFTEILPAVPKGVLIGIHDIFLPADYPDIWRGRYYSEQYLLASWLLADAGRNLRIELPVCWITECTHASAVELRAEMEVLWQRLPGTQKVGGAFWITKI